MYFTSASKKVPSLITVDTNILFYAFDPSDRSKHTVAESIVRICQTKNFVVPMQVLSEFYRATTRKKILSGPEAANVIQQLRARLQVVAANEDDLVEAMQLHRAGHLQFFDALLLCTASRAGVQVLFSEDMQHGQTYVGVRVLNPFDLAERELEQLLKV